MACGIFGEVSPVNSLKNVNWIHLVQPGLGQKLVVFSLLVLCCMLANTPWPLCFEP